MRSCEKCGKANEPTRKFCIRCGASLIMKAKPQAAPTTPKTPAPRTPVASTPAAPSAPHVISKEEEKAVKPSEVSRDRVRIAGGSKQKSELDKAREAFAKAETVGIDEADGSGVIETRMLRASEVRELLEGPGMMAGQDVPPPTMMEGSEPLPPEAAHMMTPNMPTSSQIEASIIGSKSAYADRPSTATPRSPKAPVSTPVPEEFTSSKYGSDADTPPGIEEEEVTTGFTPHTPPVAKTPTPDTTYEDDIDLVIACPDCGKTINVDMFEYPREVYAAMGAARLKQARFFVVQGKGNDALRIIRMAYALYAKAGDDKGLDEVKKIIETLAKKP